MASQKPHQSKLADEVAELETLLRVKKQMLREEKAKLTGSCTHDLLQDFWSTCRAREPWHLVGYIAVEQWKALNACCGVGVPERNGLYVRKCFRRFLSACMKQLRREYTDYVHVSGSPGIGKSTFLWYIVMMVGAVTGNPEAHDLGLEDYDVIVELQDTHNTTRWLAFYRDGSVGYHPQHHDELTSRLGDKVLHLVDRTYDGNHLGHVMVFAAGPHEESTKASVVTKILPPWSTDTDELYEFMHKQLHAPTRGEVDTIVQKWGYVPGMVFRGGSDDYDLKAAIETVSLAQAGLYAREQTCRLFEMVPDPVSYENFRVQFVSDCLARAYLDRNWETRKQELMTFAKSRESEFGDHTLAPLRKCAYKYAVARSLSEQKTTILGTSIAADARERVHVSYPPQLTLDIGGREIKRYRSLYDIQKSKKDGEELSKYLWIPEKPNPEFDFLMFEPNIMVRAVVPVRMRSIKLSEPQILKTAAFMVNMTRDNEPTSLVLVTPSVKDWNSQCLEWTRTSEKFLIACVGRYHAKYQLPNGEVLGPEKQTPRTGKISSLIRGWFRK